MALVFCFFPLAGFLADVKYGRYKMVVRSLCLLLPSVPLLAMSIGACWYALQRDIECFYHHECKVVTAVLLAVFGTIGLLFGIVSYTGLVGFAANVVQFGMDQLHDCPGEDRTLFILWHVWIYFVTIVIGQLAWNFTAQYPYKHYYKVNMGRDCRICLAPTDSYCSDTASDYYLMSC